MPGCRDASNTPGQPFPLSLTHGHTSPNECGASVESYAVRVLHVLNELKPSGAERMLRLAADPWLREGLQLEVLSTGSERGPYAATLAEAGYVVHHIPLYPVHRFIAAYRRLLRDSRFTVVHVHPERANILLAMMARTVGRAGVVRTVHNVFSFRGRLRFERRVQRAVLRQFGVLHVSVGESVAAMEETNFGNPTVIVRNTFDETRFGPASETERRRARRDFDVPAEQLLAVVVGNCSEVKNHQALIRALALPCASEFRVLHVGLEDEAATHERQLVEELGLGDRVQFLGFIDDVPRLLHGADAFVMPSLYEGLGNAALEAFSCGLPSVLADVPGLRDLRVHVPDAWWIAPEAEPISVALGDIAGMTAEERWRWSSATAATIRQEFGVERHVRGYLECYRKVARS